MQYRPSAALGAAAAAFVVLSAAAASADPVRGYVLDGNSLLPVAGATVSAPGAAPVVTDANGNYLLELPVGTVDVTVTAPGYDAATDTADVPAGGLTEKVLFVFKPGAASETVEIKDEAPVPPAPGRQDLPREQINRIPGSRGDALTAVRSLPGIGNAFGAGSGPGLLVIRGSAPEDSKITIDGIEVPVLYHFFGLQSVLPSELIENIEYLPGGFGAEQGNSTGGVINVVTRNGAVPDTTGFAEVSFINVAGFVQAPLTKSKKLTLTAAGRRSLIDFILPAVVPDTVNFTTAPQYYDGQLRLDWRPHDGDKLSMFAFTSWDLLSLINHEVNPNEPTLTRFENETSFTRLIGQWLRASAHRSNRLVLSAGISSFRVEIGDDRYLRASQDAIEARDDLTLELNKQLRLRFGASGRWNPRTLSIKFPQQPQEGQPPPGNFSTLPLVIVDTENHNDLAGAYASVDWKPRKGTTITAGGRVDYYDHIGQTRIVPRLQLTQEAGRDVTLRLAAGRYNRGFEQAESLPTNIDPEVADQYVVGAEARMSDELTASGSVFYTARKDLLVSDPLLAMTDPGNQYVNRGTGRSYGAEYLIKAHTDRFFGWLSYSYSRSDRVDGPGMPRRLFDYDQTHNVIAVGSWKLGRWELGGRWQYITGQPLTPVVGSVYLSDANAFIPLYGPVNSDRIEDGHQLDVRVDHRWKFKTWELSAYLDVQNVYAHAQVLGYSYNYDFTQRAATTMLPFLPALGVRGTF
ncbi:MAG TPA: TonB-dependent receptor [Kofleriaceae bacterium]|nr:TonB-dependent receptor [Kofleriaceae bacterium]